MDNRFDNITIKGCSYKHSYEPRAQFKSTKPPTEQIDLKRRIEIYRIRLHTEDEGVDIGYARNEYIKAMSKERRLQLYKAATDEFKTQKELSDIFKAKVRLGAEEVGVTWVSYNDDEKESGLDKAIRAVTTHIVGETYAAEAAELTKLIGNIKRTSDWLRELGKKGKGVTDEEFKLTLQILASIQDEFKGKRELFKRVAKTAADEALEIAMTKIEKFSRSFVIEILPSKLATIRTALEKRRRSLPNISLFQQGRADTLLEIKAAEQNKKGRAIVALNRAMSSISFYARDVEVREKTKERIESFISTIEIAEKNGSLRQPAQRDAILHSIETFAKSYSTTVKELQTKRDGGEVRYGVKGSMFKACWELRKGANENAILHLKNAIKLLDERIDYIRKISRELCKELRKIGKEVYYLRGRIYKEIALEQIGEAAKVLPSCAYNTVLDLLKKATEAIAKRIGTQSAVG